MNGEGHGSHPTDDSPFVGCFKVGGACFIYDVNTNEILKVDSETFDSVVRAVESRCASEEMLDRQSIRTLRERGYLSSHRPKGVSGSCRECLKSGHDSGITQVTLELTQECNHRCIYCPYSHLDAGRRGHSGLSMGIETAKAAIDLLMDHSENVEMPALGFYGGEPLLEWDLMRSCLKYSRERATGRKLLLSLTTNATLVTPEIASELAENDVSILVSLDGPEELHDSFRRMKSGGNGSHSRALLGVSYLRKAYGDQARNKIRINAVHGNWTDYSLLEDFFSTNPPAEIRGLEYRLSEVNHPEASGLSSPTHQRGGPSGEQEDAKEGPFERWTSLLELGDLESGEGRFLRKLFEAPIAQFHSRSRNCLGDLLGPMGMCEPGVRKCYIDVAGDVILCERVHERFVIGNIHEGGIDIAKCEVILKEITEAFEKRCLECVFCRVCVGCPAVYCTDKGHISEDSIDAYCLQQARVLSGQLLWYVELLERDPSCLETLVKGPATS